MVERQCQICGGIFGAETARKKLCPACRESQKVASRKKHDEKYYTSYKKGNKAKREKEAQKEPSKKLSICDSYCRGCYYLLGGDNGLMTCDYFEKADKLRPCPAGKGCTERRTPSQIFAERKEQKTAKEMQRIVCVVCGTEFSSTSEKRKACSKECSLIYRRQYRSYWKAEQNKKNKTGNAPAPVKGVELECKTCKRLFVARNRNHKYCCDDCARLGRLETYRKYDKKRK